MDSNSLPTKRNFLQAKHNLALARKGHDLLDMRHKALLHELSAENNKARIIREKLRKDVAGAHHALAVAQMELGSENVADFWEKGFWSDNLNLQYDLSDTCASLDEAFLAWRSVLEQISELSDVEKAICRLTSHIQRTRKRASALRNITIPTYETRVKYISEQLEEKERDELVRLKVSKEKRSNPQ